MFDAIQMTSNNLHTSVFLYNLGTTEGTRDVQYKAIIIILRRKKVRFRHVISQFRSDGEGKGKEGERRSSGGEERVGSSKRRK